MENLRIFGVVAGVQLGPTNCLKFREFSKVRTVRGQWVETIEEPRSRRRLPR